MDICPKCGGIVKGDYKQRYKPGTRTGEVETRVEWRCTQCGGVW